MGFSSPNLNLKLKLIELSNGCGVPKTLVCGNVFLCQPARAVVWWDYLSNQCKRTSVELVDSGSKINEIKLNLKSAKFYFMFSGANPLADRLCKFCFCDCVLSSCHHHPQPTDDDTVEWEDHSGGLE